MPVTVALSQSAVVPMPMIVPVANLSEGLGSELELPGGSSGGVPKPEGSWEDEE